MHLSQLFLAAFWMGVLVFSVLLVGLYTVPADEDIERRITAGVISCFSLECLGGFLQVGPVGLLAGPSAILGMVTLWAGTWLAFITHRVIQTLRESKPQVMQQ